MMDWRYLRILIIVLVFPLTTLAQIPDTIDWNLHQKIKIFSGTGFTLIPTKSSFIEPPVILMWKIINVGAEIQVIKRISLYGEIALPLEMHRQAAEPYNNYPSQFVTDLDPAVFTVDIRHYYLLRSTPSNGLSGNYFSLHNRVWFSEKFKKRKGIYNGPYYYIGIHTGLQRNLFHHLFFDANLGYGLNYGNNRSYFTPAISFGVGYRI